MTQEDTSVEELEVTETSQTQAKTYTQKELDDMMAKTKTAVARKYEKRLSDLGDIDELLKIKTEYENRKQEDLVKSGQFETVLQELASKKDQEIAKRDNIIREYKITTPLLESAAKNRAINAEQVKALLINNIKLNDEGEVEVIDEKGSVKYTDKGMKYSVDDLVKDFLNKNTHFVSPTPATTHSKSNVAPKSGPQLDITKLDMKNPKDREIYKQYRKDHGIA
jgi:hypothetical protein